MALSSASTPSKKIPFKGASSLRNVNKDLDPVLEIHYNKKCNFVPKKRFRTMRPLNRTAVRFARTANKEGRFHMQTEDNKALSKEGKQQKKRAFRWAPNLNAKFTIGILLLALALAISMISVTYFAYRDANLEKYRRIVGASAQTAASLLDGDQVEQYLKTGKGDAAYFTMHQNLQNLLTYNDLTYIYAYVPHFAERRAEYIFDIGVLEEGQSFEMPEHPEEIDVIYAWEMDESYSLEDDASIPIIQEVIDTRRPNLDLNLAVGEFGALASAYVPLLNSRGEYVAIIGADVAVEQVYEELNQIIGFLTIIVIGIIIVAIMLFSWYVRHNMIRPLQILVDSAHNFVANKYINGTSTEIVHINTRDELQSLAEAFNKMSLDIAQYIQDVTQLTNERERIAAELSVATKIQDSVLPHKFDIAPQPDDFKLYGIMHPAKEVGGDFYDFFMLDDDHLCMVIGDVSGKGVPAALFMMMAKSVIRYNMLRGCSLADAFIEANDSLCENNEEGMFVTVLCALIDIRTGQMQIVDAGHGCPIRVNRQGVIEPIKTKRGFVMGGMESIRYRTVDAQLEPGDMMYFFTDGVSEADNNEKELYGTARIYQSLENHWKGDLKQMLHNIHGDLITFADGAPQADDITMLAIHFKPEE